VTLKEASRVVQTTPNDISAKEVELAVSKISKVMILRTLWYPEIIDALEESTRAYLKYFGIQEGDVGVKEVPGSYELPLAVKQEIELSSNPPSFIVALGCVLKGETPHFDFVCQAVTQGLMQVQLQTGVPVGFGVLTVDTINQAQARTSKGSEAAQAALFMYLRQWNYERTQK
jgi:6,7-dimethyl-8-ribityllumazine synthase